MSINKIRERIKERKLKFLPDSPKGKSFEGSPYASPKNLGEGPSQEPFPSTFFLPKQSDKLLKNIPNISDSPMVQIEKLVNDKEYYAAVKVLQDNRQTIGKAKGNVLMGILENAIKFGKFDAARDIYKVNKDLLNEEQIKKLDELIFTTWFTTTPPEKGKPEKELTDFFKTDLERLKKNKEEELVKFRKWVPNPVK